MADDTSISLFHLDDITTDNLINDNVTIYSTFISQLEAPITTFEDGEPETTRAT